MVDTVEAVRLKVWQRPLPSKPRLHGGGTWEWQGATLGPSCEQSPVSTGAGPVRAGNVLIGLTGEGGTVPV